MDEARRSTKGAEEEGRCLRQRCLPLPWLQSLHSILTCPPENTVACVPTSDAGSW